MSSTLLSYDYKFKQSVRLNVMVRRLASWVGVGFTLASFLILGCQGVVAPPAGVEGNISFTHVADGTLATYALSGNTQPLLDPSIIRAGNTYYVFSTDVLGSSTGNTLPIRCSQDQLNWTDCGSVFPRIPGWISASVPGVVGLWAPDISYFAGAYHVYYSASTLGSQRSVIGLATNTTLDPADPNYRWIDRGEVLESSASRNFNAIDPNILVDATGAVWMTFGSYWSGIQQVRIDPLTGMPVSGGAMLSLATRPGVPNNPIEGASIVRHGNFYYLFISIDYCCKADYTTNNYKEAVGRSSSPQGPFVDRDGTPMLSGGGTVLLETQGIWIAPGGGTAYVDSAAGESLLVFHALKATESGRQYLWLKHIDWQDDWPVLL